MQISCMSLELLWLCACVCVRANRTVWVRERQRERERGGQECPFKHTAHKKQYIQEGRISGFNSFMFVIIIGARETDVNAGRVLLAGTHLSYFRVSSKHKATICNTQYHPPIVLWVPTPLARVGFSLHSCFSWSVVPDHPAVSGSAWIW